MSTSLSQFQPTHSQLICVDSDGCGMDTMTIKHERAFGPAILDIWNLENHRDDILQRWNNFNLYEITRGINRFKGLEKMLTELHEKGITVEGYDDIKYWVDHTPIFSNPQLEQDIQRFPEQHGLKLALDWSNRVNELIQGLPSVGPFDYVLDTLKKVSSFADIAIVSSANQAAVEEEWQTHHLMPYITGLFAQEAGTKEHCLAQLKTHYEQGNVLMIGDARGDLLAAESNDVYFYPILANHENASWQRFFEHYSDIFKSHKFDDSVQKDLIHQFYKNFESEEK